MFIHFLFHPERSRRAFYFFTLFLFLSIPPSLLSQVPNHVPQGYQLTAKVARVIDGDTFVLTDQTRIRLIGVDTPELKSTDPFAKYYAEEAKSFLTSLIDGEVVKLTFERGTKDIYGRTLAYVWLTDVSGKDSLFIQAELLKKGFARIAYYAKGKRYYDLFYNLRRTAMKKNLGIWSK